MKSQIALLALGLLASSFSFATVQNCHVKRDVRRRVVATFEQVLTDNRRDPIEVQVLTVLSPLTNRLGTNVIPVGTYDIKEGVSVMKPFVVCSSGEPDLGFLLAPQASGALHFSVVMDCNQNGMTDKFELVCR